MADRGTIYMISKEHGLQSFSFPCQDEEFTKDIAMNVAEMALDANLHKVAVRYVYTKIITKGVSS